MAHCPLCREPVSRASLLTLPRPHRFSVDLSDASQWRSSAKIDALLAHRTLSLSLTLTLTLSLTFTRHSSRTEP